MRIRKENFIILYLVRVQVIGGNGASCLAAQVKWRNKKEKKKEGISII